MPRDTTGASTSSPRRTGRSWGYVKKTDIVWYPPIHATSAFLGPLRTWFSAGYHMRRVTFSTECPCLVPGAAWRSRSDVMTISRGSGVAGRAQVRGRPRHAVKVWTVHCAVGVRVCCVRVCCVQVCCVRVCCVCAVCVLCVRMCCVWCVPYVCTVLCCTMLCCLWTPLCLRRNGLRNGLRNGSSLFDRPVPRCLLTPNLKK